METEKVFELLKDQVQKFSEDNPHIRSFVIGVSGGIDSAIVAALVNAAICSTPPLSASRCIISSVIFRG